MAVGSSLKNHCRMMNAKPCSRAHFRSIKFTFFSIAHQIYRASMAPRLRNALSGLSRPLDVSAVFYCPSCAIWRRAVSTRNFDKTNSLRRSARAHNTITASAPRGFNSSSVITAKSVPPRFKELHAALEGVKDASLEQVNLSRLQLALRGLESEAPLVRVAGKLLLNPWNHFQEVLKNTPLLENMTLISSHLQHSPWIERYDLRTKACQAIACRPIVTAGRLGGYSRLIRC